MAQRYAVIDAQNTVVNIVMWDGVSPYNPGESLRLVPVGAVWLDVGWTWDGITEPQPPAEDLQ